MIKLFPTQGVIFYRMIYNNPYQIKKKNLFRLPIKSELWERCIEANYVI